MIKNVDLIMLVWYCRDVETGKILDKSTVTISYTEYAQLKSYSGQKSIRSQSWSSPDLPRLLVLLDIIHNLTSDSRNRQQE